MINELSEILKCPNTGENLLFQKEEFSNVSKTFKYKVERNLIRMLEQKLNKIDVKTSVVRNFYLKDPFPNYNGFDNIEKFIKQSSSSEYINSISKIIKPNDTVLEFGSGTSQLGNYLAATNYAKIICADLTLESLRLGQKFANDNKIKGINFIETDIFNHCFKENIFDVIICSGVLHHTIDPYLAFQNLVKLVKPGGYIIIGLYNKISRIKNSMNKYLSKIFGKKILNLFDPIYKSKTGNAKESWYQDQYKHPLEKRYTFKDLHLWFEKNNINFINSLPKYITSIPFHLQSKRGDEIDQINIQLIDLLNNNEGGLFVFLGKKFKK